MIFIGIDPDSSKHGVAVYRDNGKIAQLLSLPLFGVFDLIMKLREQDSIQVHIENVCANNATFGKQFVKNRRAETTVSRSLGMCQQAQTEVERMAEYLGVEVVRHPISSNWKDSEKGKKILAQLGWEGKSNEDSRSAAYFGYCGVKAWHTANRK